jgi:DNA-binding transcriptional LysR family regulator
VSKQVQELERALGVHLFDRGGHRGRRGRSRGAASAARATRSVTGGAAARTRRPVS